MIVKHNMSKADRDKERSLQKEVTARKENTFHLPDKRTTRRETHHQSKEKGRADQLNSGTASARVGEVIVWYTNTDVLTKKKLTELRSRTKSHLS